MSLPEEFLKRMEAMLSTEEYDSFIKSYDKARVRGLRIHTPKGSAEEFFRKTSWEFKRIPWTNDGYFYEESLAPGKLPYHDAGVYYIQEPSAMAPAEYLQAKPGEAVLDLCAAPGGKTTAIAAQMKGEGLLVANEIHPQRARILSENVERMGISGALVLNETPQRLATAFGPFFDRVLVDAPCSGEGLFRKQEDAASEWSKHHVRMCAARQDEILDAAYEMLRPGGVMVYSTCTFAPDENEGSVCRLLFRHPDLTICEAEKYPGMTGGKRAWTEAFATLDGASIPDAISYTIRMFPQNIDGEGHFLAVLKKAGDAKRGTFATEKTRKCSEWKELEKFFEEMEMTKEALFDGAYISFGEQIYMVPDGLVPLKGLKVLRPGLHIGTVKKNRMEPVHALALYLHPEEIGNVCDLGVDDERLLSYLRGETFSYEGKAGWYLICVDGYSIGWGKLVGTTMKNHYPKGLRKP